MHMRTRIQHILPDNMRLPFWIIVLRILLDILYCTMIQPAFAYYGFQNDFSVFRYVLSWLMLAAMIFAVTNWRDKEYVSYKITFILLCFSYLPTIVLYAYMDAPFILHFLLYYSILVISVTLIPPLEIKDAGRGYRLKRYILLLIVAVLLCNEVFIWARYSNFHLQLDLGSVYETREEAKTYSIPRILGYLHSWSRTTAPFLAIYFLHKKQRLLFVLMLLCQLIAFFIDASRLVLFSIILCIGLYFLLRHGRSFIRFIPVGLSGVSIASLLEKPLLGTILLSSLTIRRMMFTPSLLNYMYFEYFTSHGFDYFRSSFLGRFFPSPYKMGLADTIGQAYFNSSMHANNGLFSDAYANLGVIGVIVMPLLMALVLRVLDGSTRRVPPVASQAFAITFGFSLISSSFFTVLLTHGLLFACLVPYFCKSDSCAE